MVTLQECPPGPFLFNGILGFKTEYGAMTPADARASGWTVSHYPDAYVMESGEYFWGGAKSKEERAALMVEPCAVELAS